MLSSGCCSLRMQHPKLSPQQAQCSQMRPLCRRKGGWRENRSFPSWGMRMELVLQQKPSALLCRLSSQTPQLPLPAPALPLAIKALCSQARLVQAAGKRSLAFPLLKLQGKNTANKTSLSNLPACHVQAISLSLLLAFLPFFFFLLPHQLGEYPGKQRLVMGQPCLALGWGMATLESECCVVLLQRVAAHLCTDLTVILSPQLFLAR